MRRPTIKTALSAILTSIGITVAAFSGYTLKDLDAANSTLSEVVNVQLPALEMVKDIEVRLGDIRTAYRTHLLQRDRPGKEAASKLIEQSVASLDEDADRFDTLSSSDRGRASLETIRRNFAEYMDKGKEVLALSNEGRQDEALAMLKEVMMTRAEALRNASTELTEMTKRASHDAFEAAQLEFSTTFYLTIASVFGLLVTIAAAVWFVLTNVARPIETINQSMRALASGDTQSEIPFAGRSDEIGGMAEAVEVFRRNAVENARLENEAAESRARGEDERERRAREQAKRSSAMERATAGLGDGLRHLAEGDLEFRLREDFAPEFERLRADFNSAAETLRNTLSEVARTTEAIDEGSTEISGSVDDLSRRTEQQAAALEETAAALDQITANVTQSAKRADEARSAAQQATLSTGDGGVVVSGAVEAMIKIEQSSEQIAGIIGVIDEIAFQTNLLALNAGVEAARAGEAGKGFAVVAQEVRELAQRSARAAREIKGLIQQSTMDVGNGVKLVRETGAALKAIESHVAAINLNMDAIATSAKEQSAGLLQVNTAVNQMDQVTQQNAAMVEETNAASAGLASEATRLRGLIGRFELGGAEIEHLRPAQASFRSTQLKRPKLAAV